MNTEQIVESVLDQGFALVPQVLSEADCRQYKAMLERDYRRYSPLHVSSDTTGHGLNNKLGEKVVYNLHNKDLRYFDLFDQAAILPAVFRLLQLGSYQEAEQVNLLNISARCPLKGAGHQQLHLDSNLPGMDRYPLIVNVVWALDAFSRDSGATRVIPGSHRYPGYAETGVEYPDEQLVEAPPGSALVFNASLWHGGQANLSGADRWAVLLGYGRWFIKPSFDFRLNTPPEIYRQLSDRRKDLLGFNAHPPGDEFTRVTRRSPEFEPPAAYRLPETDQTLADH